MTFAEWIDEKLAAARARGTCRVLSQGPDCACDLCMWERVRHVALVAVSVRLNSPWVESLSGDVSCYWCGVSDAAIVLRRRGHQAGEDHGADCVWRAAGGRHRFWSTTIDRHTCTECRHADGNLADAAGPPHGRCSNLPQYGGTIGCRCVVAEEEEQEVIMSDLNTTVHTKLWDNGQEGHLAYVAWLQGSRLCLDVRHNSYTGPVKVRGVGLEVDVPAGQTGWFSSAEVVLPRELEALFTPSTQRALGRAIPPGQSVLDAMWGHLQARALHDPLVRRLVSSVEQGMSREQALMQACHALSVARTKLQAQLVEAINRLPTPADKAAVFDAGGDQ